MMWDFAEGNYFGKSSAGWREAVDNVADCLETLAPAAKASVTMADAASMQDGGRFAVVTDPPYYDNVGYADLSDFFYVWLRRSIGSDYPDLFSTLVTPKDEELIASPYRFGGSKVAAEEHFRVGLASAFRRIRDACDPGFPVIVYYAFKQAEEDREGLAIAIASTGWETMLEGLLQAGFSINGTWPMRTEGATRMIARGTNALASSIALVCRPRQADAGITTRRDFVASLKRELPDALRRLEHGNIAPVDLAQASIGPGMSIFSRYAKVLEPDGESMSVRAALGIINQALSEILAQQEGDFDPDTRWAVAWYEQFGFGEGPYGQAEVLSKAKDIGIEGLVRSGIVEAARGKVRLVARESYDVDADAAGRVRVSVWEVTQRVIHVLRQDGEGSAAQLLARVGGLADSARALAYQLYGIAEKKGWSDDGQAYNALVVAWPTILIQAERAAAESPQQSSIDFA
jgi:putative DNA methylase